MGGGSSCCGLGESAATMDPLVGAAEITRPSSVCLHPETMRPRCPPRWSRGPTPRGADGRSADPGPCGSWRCNGRGSTPPAGHVQSPSIVPSVVEIRARLFLGDGYLDGSVIRIVPRGQAPEVERWMPGRRAKAPSLPPPRAEMPRAERKVQSWESIRKCIWDFLIVDGQGNATCSNKDE